MKGLFEAFLQLLFKLLSEVSGQFLGEILEKGLSVLNYFAYKLNPPFEISFFDEITKLDLFESI